MIPQNIVSKALHLPPSERVVLAQKLLNSLTGDEAIDSQWLKLAEKRLKELEKGTVKPLSWKKIRAAVTK